MSRIAKIGFIALTMALGIGATSSPVEASGYFLWNSVTGDVECQPGGEGDCPTA